jgi:class 3 adenylate cyclase/streptogramin lyase
MIRRGRAEGRLLATVLFTDLVGSTERAVELGDRAWRVLLRRHHSAVRRELRRFGGHEVDSAGDGFFATFPQPADAVRCALAIRAANRPLNLVVRSGVHTGEVERIGPKVGGVAVHLAARVLSAAERDEVLVTSTVRDLVAGSELTFQDAGTKDFKGFSEPWHVFRATGPEPDAAAATEEPHAAAPSRRTAIALGGVIGAALVIGVLVLLGVAGQPTGVEPGPNTVVRLAAENEVGDALAVAHGPSAMVVADGALWVASEAGTVTRVDLDDHAAQVVGGVGIPTALASADGSIWVAEAYAGRVSRIDAATVQVRDSVDVHARRILATSDALWMTDDLGDRVTRLSTATLDEDGAVALEAASGPRAIAAGGNGSIWVGNERSATLVKIDAASAASIGHPIGLGSPATELAVGNGSVWVTSMDADRLYRIDLEQGQVVATIETCDGPDAVVATDEGVWIACRVGQVVRRLATDGSFVADIEVPGVPAALATDGVGVWVALRGD